MTNRRRLFPTICTAAVLCAALAACGGQNNTPASGAAYKGAGIEDRTAAVRRNGSSQMPLEGRIARLEQDVAILKNDMGQIALSYNGLMTTNERIDSLIAHMEDQQAKSVPVPVPTPVVEKVQSTPAPKKPEAKPASASPVVTGVRIGEHPGVTRLVIDWNKLGDVKTDLDNSEKLLLVTLSKTDWQGKTLVSGLSSPLVAGWSVDENGGGKILAIQLKKSVSIKNISKLKAEGDQSARVVIDLVPAS